MKFAKTLRWLSVLALWPSTLFAQFTITGVADKGVYTDTVSLTVNTQAGYTYSATLNYKPIPVGVAVVSTPDFYELRVSATNSGNAAVTSQYLRFIVNTGARGTTEMGIPPHVPFPLIQSSPSEFTGARLRVLVPANFPTGYEIPIVGWVVDDDNHPVRANGLLAAAGQNSIQIKRGGGSGFLASNQPPGVLNYAPSIGGIVTNKPVTLEAGTVWTNVSGALGAVTTWPGQSRMRVTGNLTIPAGGSLTIGAGAVVLLNGGINITNDGAVVINGSVEEPVVFMPNARTQPWGGFYMRSSASSLTATGAIFVASGAAQTGAPGHRPEQCLILVSNSPSILLSDSAAIYMAGQFGHAYNGGTFTLTRFLMQRATTGGEYTRASFTVNDSAFMECPDDSVNFVDGDNDALYLISGVHGFTNTLFGWTKDDGVDSGGTDSSGNYAQINYQSCWFESTFHEGNSWSGFKNIFSRDTVYFDVGQGIECGYDAPTGRLDHCFFSMCKSGIRHGDNYTTIGNYDGRLTSTNNISIYNHRDLFGFNWHSPGGWTNSYDRFWASNNFVSAATYADTNYPNNFLWNPESDGWRLASLGGVGRAGVGFGNRGSSLGGFPDGIPVGLSRFCTNEVRVDYTIDGSDGSHAAGTLIYPAGLTRNYIPAPTNLNGVLRVGLLNPVNADVTGVPSLLFQNLPANANGDVTLSPYGANWRYLDDGSEQGTAWRATNFNDSAWSNGMSRLGFGGDAAPVATTIRKFVQVAGVDTTRQVTNFYFRRAIVVTNPAAFTNIQFRYQKDDGCVVYLNGNQIFTNNMGLPPYTANTFAAGTISGAPALLTFWTNTISTNAFLAGTNVIAVEVHQSTATSSDIAWHMELVGIVPPQGPRLSLARLGTDAVLYWGDGTFGLQEADFVIGPWRPANPTNSPSASAIISNRFFRLAK